MHDVSSPLRRNVITPSLTLVLSTLVILEASDKASSLKSGLADGRDQREQKRFLIVRKTVFKARR